MFVNDSQTKQSRSVPVGLFHSLLACLYWGIVFVIPNLLESFQELDIVLTRYTIFGIFSLFPILWKRQNIFKNISLHVWGQSFLWAFLVNMVYYFGIALAIRYVGAAITIIIAGLAPIAVLFHSNVKKKELSYTLLSAISCVIFLGVVLTNLSEFHSTTAVNPLQYFIGLSCVIISTGIWVAYIICNYDFLLKNPNISPDLWCGMLGVASLAICLPLIIIFDCLGITHIAHNFIAHTPTSERLLFILLCSAMGIFSSSRAITSWNKASLHLSPALLGAMLIFEPIFGLILSYLYEKTLPTLQEGVGIFLMLGGSLICLILFGRKANQKEPEESKILPSAD
ncbi:DMT family transporter [Chlamydia crocodili]|uniref:DMT family transporter n=1 Tax=Chlamydia crocodili TaxID=2766982 RepID=A0ABX8CFE5_9CHLA|nr:DMT family transporter [Chlamydia crocodili]QVE49169.1 DMT family transporter [Chlamydia crocodili]